MKTWTTVDKSSWPLGEWNAEPDKAHWVAHDLDCLIVRGPSGALCGYVGVPASHQYFEKKYDNCDVRAHWGLTFSDRCAPDGDSEESRHICHPKDGAANEKVWWLGFDCAHCGDISPSHGRDLWYADASYKNFDYVKRETEWLARQLQERA